MFEREKPDPNVCRLKHNSKENSKSRSEKLKVLKEHKHNSKENSKIKVYDPHLGREIELHNSKENSK